MNRRVFIAINLPDEIRERIATLRAELETKARGVLRFLPPENWHVTLLFLGYQNEDSLAQIVQVVAEVARSTTPPLIEFEKITYGPLGREPRMIWMLGTPAVSKRLGLIQRRLMDALVKHDVYFRIEDRAFTLHLTLARTSNPQPLSGRLDWDFHAQFVGEGLTVMESVLRREGAEYRPLSHFDFEGDI